MSKKTFIFLLIILCVAVFFRFWQLEQIPPGLYPDVAVNGNNALDALKTGNFKLFYPDNNGREGLFINLIAFSFWLFGASVWAIKVVPAIIGVLTILGLFFLARVLFSFLSRTKSDFIALASTFILSISFWHVNFSRLGFRAILVPFFLVWSFYFLFKALNATRIYESHPNDPNCIPENKSVGGQALNEDQLIQSTQGGAAGFERKPAPREAGQGWSGWLKAKSPPHRLICFILAGIFFGLGFHTYISYRVAPLILIPVAIFSIIAYWGNFKNFIKEQLWKWAIFLFFVALTVSPLLLYFAKNPQDLIGRAGQVSVFSSASPIKELAITTVKTLGMFNIYGDCNWRHNYPCQPELYWPIGALFAIGFFFSVLEIFKPANYRQQRWQLLAAHWTLLFMFFVMLLPAILSMEGLPHALRSIGTIPSVFIFAGLGLFFIFDGLKNLYLKKNLKLFTLYLLIFLLLGGSAYAEYNRYFLDWGQREETKAEFTQRLVDQGNYLNSLPDDVIKYVMVNEDGVPVPYPDGIPMPAQTIMFIIQEKPNIKYLLPSQNSQILISPKPTVLLPLRYDGNLFSQLKEKIPDGKIEKINNEFSVFKIGF
ncbi:hypothetical protein KJ853_03575 [Patescibacteria group bacterium]|nr:hypothetical protein [Patescibacteria group bacterium]